MFGLNYKDELNKIFQEIGENQFMAFATCSKNFPTVRTMSVVIIDNKIYFQTGNDSVKYKQFTENKNVALCYNNIQMEGVANNIGKPVEHESIMEKYKKYYESSYEKYSKLDKEILVEVKIKNIIKWEYINGEPYRLIINIEKENVYREKI
jgi:uncharacterized pyridoxamine 5'-phosphate oxidase family protein